MARCLPFLASTRSALFALSRRAAWLPARTLYNNTQYQATDNGDTYRGSPSIASRR